MPGGLTLRKGGKRERRLLLEEINTEEEGFSLDKGTGKISRVIDRVEDEKKKTNHPHYEKKTKILLCRPKSCIRRLYFDKKKEKAGNQQVSQTTTATATEK